MHREKAKWARVEGPTREMKGTTNRSDQGRGTLHLRESRGRSDESSGEKRTDKRNNPK